MTVFPAALTFSAETARGIRAVLGVDPQRVTVHIDGMAERWGAAACCHGSNIHLSADWHEAPRAAQAFVLGHELVHVRQQLEGRVCAPGGGETAPDLLYDATLEAEADRVGLSVADVLCQGPDPWFVPIAERPRDPAFVWSAVQRTVALEIPGQARRVLADATAAYDDLYSNCSGPFKNTLILYKTTIMEVLNRWVGTSNYMLIRMARGHEAMNRTYRSWDNLARAVIGEASSSSNIDRENELAIAARGSRMINDKLATLVTKVADHVKTLPKSRAKTDMESKWFKGRYSWWYFTRVGGFPGVVNNPSAAPFAAKVAVLHDYTDFFWAHSRAVVNVPPAKCRFYAFVGQDATGKSIFNKLGTAGRADFRNADGTLKEDNPIIIAARENHMPLSYGPSFTTGRLMQMTETVHGEPQEFTAMAWGIFAFWNQDYYHSFSGMHRFHSVMDMASNYGVPYRPWEYPKDVPDYFEV